MIPKVIHYCWFGRNKKSDLAEKCIESWKKYFPDYEIIEWNESNFDININEFVSEAYKQKKYAFCSDFARLYVIYNYGGIYFDTDVEVIKQYGNILESKAFFGLESVGHIATGLGFGAEKGNMYVKRMLEDYEKRKFDISENTLEEQSCPILNSKIMKELGFKLDGSQETIDGVTIYPIDYFNPKGGFGMSINITPRTLSIHHFDGSWISEESRKRSQMLQKMQLKFGKKLGKVLYNLFFLPYIIFSSLKELGVKKTFKKIIVKYKGGK